MVDLFKPYSINKNFQLSLLWSIFISYRFFERKSLYRNTYNIKHTRKTCICFYTGFILLCNKKTIIFSLFIRVFIIIMEVST